MENLVVYQKKETVLHRRSRKGSMVFLFILFLPYILSAFLSKSNNESQAIDLLSESRIKVKLTGINGESQISLEEFLCGHLPLVIPIDYEEECLKAQAILLRTQMIYLYKQQMEQGLDYIEIEGENYLTRKQLENRWGNNYYEYNQKIRQIVSKTKGIYITYDGNPIQISYFAVSGGNTRNSEEVLKEELPYLKSVNCPKDYLAEDYLTQITLRKKTLQDALPGSMFEYEYDSVGYCTNIITEDGTISAQWLRDNYYLPSTNFTVEEKGENLLFIVKGVGHGLGMSQFAANEFAKDDMNYDEILNYFFQNISLDKYE